MLPMRQSNTHQMELSTISLSMLQRCGTWPFATNCPKNGLEPYDDRLRGHYDIGGEEDRNLNGEC